MQEGHAMREGGEGGGVVQLQQLMQPQSGPRVCVRDEARRRLQRRKSLADHERAARGGEGPAREHASDVVRVVGGRGCSDMHGGKVMQDAARECGCSGGGKGTAGDEGYGGCSSTLDELRRVAGGERLGGR